MHVTDLSVRKLVALLGFLLLVQANTSGAGEFYTVAKSERLVSGMPPPRDQGELAFCYAAVPAVLLDRLRCKQNSLNCKALRPKQQISMLHLSTQRFRTDRQLDEYGNINAILQGLKDRMARGREHLASEACAPYNSIARKDMPERPAHLHLRAGWEYLRRNYDLLQRMDQGRCTDCMASDLRNRLDLKTPVGQLRRLMKRDYSHRPLPLSGFMFRAVVPQHCLYRNTERVAIPDFTWHTWPSRAEDAQPEKVMQRIESLVNRNIPVSLAYCSAWEFLDENARCQNLGGHASIVVGHRKVCDRDSGECWKLYKLQNSYGMAWQEKSYHMWVRADKLVSAAMELRSRRHFLTWVN